MFKLNTLVAATLLTLSFGAHAMDAQPFTEQDHQSALEDMLEDFASVATLRKKKETISIIEAYHLFICQHSQEALGFNPARMRNNSAVLLDACQTELTHQIRSLNRKKSEIAPRNLFATEKTESREQ